MSRTMLSIRALIGTLPSFLGGVVITTACVLWLGWWGVLATIPASAAWGFVCGLSYSIWHDIGRRNA